MQHALLDTRAELDPWCLLGQSDSNADSVGNARVKLDPEDEPLKLSDLTYTKGPNGSVEIWLPDGDACGHLYGSVANGWTAEYIAGILGIKKETT
jgi:hypothetical protein